MTECSVIVQSYSLHGISTIPLPPDVTLPHCYSHKSQCLAMLLTTHSLFQQILLFTTFDVNSKIHLVGLFTDVFKDQVVWITGASSGIGECLAVALAKQVSLGSSLILTIYYLIIAAKWTFHCFKP